MQQKYELVTRLTYFWHKNEKKIFLNFVFVFEPLLFRHTCHALNTICGGGQLLVTESQGPITSFPGVRIPSPRAQGLSSRVLVVLRPRVPVPGPQVLILDYALILVRIFSSVWKYSKIFETLDFKDLRSSFVSREDAPFSPRVIIWEKLLQNKTNDFSSNLQRFFLLQRFH